jgi:hypothetical protein
VDSDKARALERILEALIGAGEGEAFMAVIGRLGPDHSVRITIEPQTLDAAQHFDVVSHPRRWRA